MLHIVDVLHPERKVWAEKPPIESIELSLECNSSALQSSKPPLHELEVKMPLKRIGVLVHDASPFANGCIQNAYFLRLCLERAGFAVDFLGLQAGTFKVHDLPILGLDAIDASQYSAVVTVTRLLSRTRFETLSAAGVLVVDYVCGQLAMFHTEEWIYGNTRGFLADSQASKRAHAVWLSSALEHLRAYVETVSGLPVTVVPYVWGPGVLEAHASRTQLLYEPLLSREPQLELLIVEPNVNYSKSAWLPLVAAERLHRKHPGLIRRVHVLGFPIKTDAASMMADSLTLHAHGLLSRYSRLPITKMMQNLSKCRAKVVVLTHQVDLPLNYAYLELLYYGYPLVHNSPTILEQGYFYLGSDIEAAGIAVLRAYNDHDANVVGYAEKAAPLLASVDPTNSLNVGKLKHLLQLHTLQHASSTPSTAPSPVELPPVAAPLIPTPVSAPLIPPPVAAPSIPPVVVPTVMPPTSTSMSDHRVELKQPVQRALVGPARPITVAELLKSRNVTSPAVATRPVTEPVKPLQSDPCAPCAWQGLDTLDA